MAIKAEAPCPLPTFEEAGARTGLLSTFKNYTYTIKKQAHRRLLF